MDTVSSSTASDGSFVAKRYPTILSTPASIVSCSTAVVMATELDDDDDAINDSVAVAIDGMGTKNPRRDHSS